MATDMLVFSHSCDNSYAVSTPGINIDSSRTIHLWPLMWLVWPLTLKRSQCQARQRPCCL